MSGIQRVQFNAGCQVYSAHGGTTNALLTNSLVQVGAAGLRYLFGVAFLNFGSSGAWVQMFDAASTGAVTLGTTVPKLSFFVGGNNGVSGAAGGWEEKFAADGRILFSNGLIVAATTTATNNSAPSTGIDAQITYR